MKKTIILFATALSVASTTAHAAVVTKSFQLTASGFTSTNSAEAAPLDLVTGLFTLSYDDAAFISGPTPVTLSGFNLPFDGTANYTLNKGSNALAIGNAVAALPFSYTVGAPAGRQFGFFLKNISGSPFVTDFNYSVNGKIFQSTNVTLSAPVPEPATWAMMIVGFGAIGHAFRRRKGVRIPQFV